MIINYIIKLKKDVQDVSGFFNQLIYTEKKNHDDNNSGTTGFFPTSSISNLFGGSDNDYEKPKVANKVKIISKKDS